MWVFFVWGATMGMFGEMFGPNRSDSEPGSEDRPEVDRSQRPPKAASAKDATASRPQAPAGAGGLSGGGGGSSGPVTAQLDAIEGKVKWFDPRKGFGFIVGPEGQDIFVHFSIILGDGFRVLKDGATVQYSAEKTDKGWKATRCQRVEQIEVQDQKKTGYTRSPRR